MSKLTDAIAVNAHGNTADTGTSDSSLATSPSSLPGYLPWEQDLQMVSKFMDKKVYTCV